MTDDLDGPASAFDGDGDAFADSDSDSDTALRGSLSALSRLSTSGTPLEDTLTAVAALAVNAIPGADGAGLTLLEQGRADTMVATADFVSTIDEIQYRIGQGPCISAATEGRTVISSSLGGDRRWLKFGSQVARLGVHSVVSIPLLTPDGVVGAMNVYAHAKNAFDVRAASLGELFAGPAAIAVRNAQVLAETRRLAIHLQRVLDGRGTIDRALGIIMSRSGGTEEEALNRLRDLSQLHHRKLEVVAQQFVDEAVRRAKARHAGG